jgi:hemolysin activation/secretion protein
MGATGGSNTTLGFGGDKFFRGFESNRFLDRLRLSVSVELRWDPLTFGFAKQQLTLGFVPFFDIGRVWPSLFPLTVGSLHASTGWGMRLIWNNRFIIRSDVAFNSERVGMYVELGSSF